MVMRNVIDACIAHKSKLVFFDNVYLYDEDEMPRMTEESRINPPSRKGKVRLQLVRMIEEAPTNRSLQALIARCADFYGQRSEEHTSELQSLKTNSYAFFC